MIKKRYFVISGGKYSSPLFYFQDLDSAMEMFKMLQSGKHLEVNNESVKTWVPKSKDKDGYEYKYYHFEEEKEPEFHLSSKIEDIYTKEEIKAIQKTESEKLAKAEKEAKKK
jgi:hypothetical protein